jgi:hypothetical protein
LWIAAIFDLIYSRNESDEDAVDEETEGIAIVAERFSQQVEERQAK